MATGSQRKRIPIEDGITTFGTGFEIGLQLRQAQRYVGKYIPQESGVVVNFDTHSWEPFEVDDDSLIALDDCSEVFCGERFENVESSGNNTGYLFGGRRISTGTAGIWDQTGTRVGGSGSATAFSSIMHWRSLATPTTFCTGPTMFSTTDRVNFVPYAPTGFPGVAKILMVYQNRLWLSIGNKLYFTDVLDPNNVRQFGQINPLVVPMPITCLERVGVSDIDPGAQSHLLIGGATQIWVVDGAPGQGNQILRRYTSQVGIEKEEHAVSTNLGVAFFGTDRQLYLVPPGAVDEPIPIGLRVRDIISAPGDRTLVWRRPYLAVILGNIRSVLYFDVSGGGGEMKVWGTPGLFSSYSVRACSNRFPLHDYVWVAGRDGSDIPELCVIHKMKDVPSKLVPLTQKLKTGYIFELGHEVVLRKMHATVEQGPIAKTYTATSYDSNGGSYSRTFTVPAGSKTTSFQIPMTGPNGIRGEFLYLELSVAGRANTMDKAMSALRHWEVEYDVIKRSKI